MMGPNAVRVEQVTPRLHFARTEHVNWVIYDGADGVMLIDSGYLGQRAELEQSLRGLGHGPADVDAVLVTHAHADHIGGASWLAGEFGVPVYTRDAEVAHLRRERLEQVGPLDVVRNALHRGVLGWAVDILPLVEGRPKLGVSAAQAIPLRDGAVADLPGVPRVIAAPGHTSGTSMFHFADERAVVVGDVLITDHRTARRRGPQILHPMFHNDPAGARAALDQLSSLDADILLPGHGPSWRGRPLDAASLARLR